MLALPSWENPDRSYFQPPGPFSAPIHFLNATATALNVFTGHTDSFCRPSPYTVPAEWILTNSRTLLPASIPNIPLQVMEENPYGSSGPRRDFEAHRTDMDENPTPSTPLVEHKWYSPPTPADTGDAVTLAGQSREPSTPSNNEFCLASLPEHSTISQAAATSSPDIADADHGTVLLQGNTQIPSICVHHHSGAGAGDSHLLQDASSPAWCLGVPQLNRMAVTAPLNDVRFLAVPWSRPHHCDELPRADTRKRKMLLWLDRVYTLINARDSFDGPTISRDADQASTSRKISSGHGPNPWHQPGLS
ncbi:hypothetical protein PC9H_010835 [Pleurotus ostreatus]|uniref:Uncharacterized protein n=1 Tax=Pleurotus ostreatus TaxID=5322 RepID=A0A8H6ZNJ3_PLEOS|nr:uncharacterized protein PC9H_010835 [Pleurotus ostreatus]KAF7422679.1 hypothetical protein PC9H_010835 [Pleurotus ostreatus]